MNILTKFTVDKGNTPKDIQLIRRLIENEGNYSSHVIKNRNRRIRKEYFEFHRRISKFICIRNIIRFQAMRISCRKTQN
jgi:hypothetical protein